MTERGHWQAGIWIPEKVILRSWRYGKMDDSIEGSPQEAWNTADFLSADCLACPEYIEIDGRRIYLGLFAREHGGIEESERIMREEYGVDTSERDR